jgi:hypothetical protein
MKTLEINKGGFGIVSLFNNESTKNELIEQSDLGGYYLNELGIDYTIGDEIKLKTPVKRLKGAYTICNIRVYNVTKDLYECELIVKKCTFTEN